MVVWILKLSNYNPDATSNQVDSQNDDNPCEYFGCTDVNAINYDPNANVEDGTCDCGDATSYIINMQDSFGDGWNGNNLIITNSEGSIIGSNTIEDENGSEAQNIYLLTKMIVLVFHAMVVIGKVKYIGK